MRTAGDMVRSFAAFTVLSVLETLVWIRSLITVRRVAVGVVALMAVMVAAIAVLWLVAYILASTVSDGCAYFFGSIGGCY